jgi:hypothetical protein
MLNQVIVNAMLLFMATGEHSSRRCRRHTRGNLPTPGVGTQDMIPFRDRVVRFLHEERTESLSSDKERTVGTKGLVALVWFKLS